MPPASTHAQIYAHTQVYAQTEQSGNLTLQFLRSLEQGRELRILKCCVTPGRPFPLPRASVFLLYHKSLPSVGFCKCMQATPHSSSGPQRTSFCYGKAKANTAIPPSRGSYSSSPGSLPLASRSRASVSSQWTCVLPVSSHSLWCDQGGTKKLLGI